MKTTWLRYESQMPCNSSYVIIMLLSDGKIWIYVHLVTDFITLTAGFCMLASSFCCAIFIPKLLVWGTVARLAGSGIKRLTFYWQDVPTSDPHTHTHTVILWEQQQKGIMGADGGWTAGWYEVKIGHHLNAVLNPRQHIYSTWMSDCGRRR